MYENAVSTVLCVCDDVGFGREWPVCADAVARDDVSESEDDVERLWPPGRTSGVLQRVRRCEKR